MIFLNLRTDLALERQEIVPESDSEGIFSRKYSEEGIEITHIKVFSENGARAIGKPIGSYITFEVTPFSRGSDLFSSPELRVISRHIKELIPESEEPVLVAGLGNSEITADSLGPKTASMIFSTRHIGTANAENLGLGKIRSVAAVSTGVLGKTGIETGEMIDGIVKKIKPCAVVVVDALAARRLERLGTTLQLSTGGIVPGSGVGNSRQRIDSQTLGVPVISLGVPTVIDAATFIYDITGLPENEIDEAEKRMNSRITVTPKDIDIMTERASRLIAMSINCALQGSISPEEIFSIVSQ